MESLNGELVSVDFTPFCDIAQLLYNSAFVAERYAGIRGFINSKKVQSLLSKIQKKPKGTSPGDVWM